MSWMPLPGGMSISISTLAFIGSDGIGLFIYPRYVLNTFQKCFVMVYWLIFQPPQLMLNVPSAKARFYFTHTQPALSSVNVRTVVSRSLEFDGLCEGL